ncbi:MAG: hypothetical protein FD133_430 [Erysipelotrichaceae bacterium]|nr:MAG: hypothetical protein FD179_1047 [Erysipelotrichaceae bacterium]TXT19258.1 MAG: hypothetical protein FD133_430 [Erysipelotrichaceae bacterium]
MRNSRTKNVFLILIWSLVAAVAVYFLYSAVQSGEFTFQQKYEGEPSVILSDVTLSESVESLAIEWISGGVKIIPTTGDKIRIVEKAYKVIAENKEVKITVLNSKLELVSRNKAVFNFLWFTSAPTFLEVYLPITTNFNLIKLKGVSGNYSIDDVYSNLIQVDLVSGNLTLDNSFAALLSMDLTSGNAVIKDSELLSADIEITSGQLNYAAKTQSFKIKMTSGTMKLDLLEQLPQSLSLKMTSGSANITLHGTDGFGFVVKKTSGSFTTDFEVITSGNTYTYKSGGPLYTVDLTSGSVNTHLK